MSFVYPQVTLARKTEEAVARIVENKWSGWNVSVPDLPDPGLDLLFDLCEPQTQQFRRISINSATAALCDADGIRQEVLTALAQLRTG